MTKSGEPQLWHRYSVETDEGLIHTIIYCGFVSCHGHGRDYFNFREIVSGEPYDFYEDWSTRTKYVGPPEMTIVPLHGTKEDPSLFASKSDLNALVPFHPYFRDLMEGKDGVESWFLWFNQNGDFLERVLTRNDFIRLKSYTSEFISKILENAGTSFKRSHRYSWAIGYNEVRRKKISLP